MKRIYEAPGLEVTILQESDIIVTSGGNKLDSVTSGGGISESFSDLLTGLQ